MFNQSQVFNALLSLLCGILGAFLTQPFFMYSVQRIAMVNITGMVDSFVKEITKQSFTPDQMKQKVSQFGEAMNITLQTISHQKKLVLVPSEAVVAGATDLTDEVRELIKKRLNT